MLWEYSHSVEANNVTPEKIWLVWQDVANWPKWDHELSRCELMGDFIQGASVIIKPARGPKVRGKIVRCERNKFFTVESPITFCTKAVFDHEMGVTATGVKITHKATIKGPLTFVFKRFMGRSIQKSLPAVMDKMLKRAL